MQGKKKERRFLYTDKLLSVADADDEGSGVRSYLFNNTCDITFGEPVLAREAVWNIGTKLILHARKWLMKGRD